MLSGNDRVPDTNQVDTSSSQKGLVTMAHAPIAAISRTMNPRAASMNHPVSRRDHEIVVITTGV
jgi:hypothetical protein